MKLSVVGGTYTEKCMFPDWDELWGSGLRGAAAVKSLGCDVAFSTYVGRGDHMSLRSRARALGIELENVCLLDKSVEFHYVHGLSMPQIVDHGVENHPPGTS